MVHYSESNMAFAHPLRKAILWSYIPAFALCIAASCISNCAVPGLGLIPLSFSAILSVTTLAIARHQRKKSIQLPAGNHDGCEGDEDKGPLLLSPIAVFAYDVSLATFLMIVLLFTWDKQNSWNRYSWHRWNHRSQFITVSTYATVPLLLAHVTHIYLALVSLFQAFQYALKRDHQPSSITCPNCSTHIKTKSRSWFGRRQRRNGPYSALGEEDYQGDMGEQVSARKNVMTSHVEEVEDASKDQGKGKSPEEPSISPIDD